MNAAVKVCGKISRDANPANALVRFSYAMVLANQGKIEEPLTEFETAARQDPTIARLAQVYERVAQNCEEQGRIIEARALAARARELGRKHNGP